jgi:hypothetical protein
MAETKDSTILVGKALYTEFRKDGHTLQMIFTPEAMFDDKYVPATIWRRQISSWNPRRPWRAYSQEWATLNERKDYRNANAGSPQTFTDKDEANAYAVKGLLFIDRTFASLIDSDWTLYKEPVVIDFSREDLENTMKWDTPTALIRRITRSRKALGFDEALFDEPAPTSV